MHAWTPQEVQTVLVAVIVTVFTQVTNMIVSLRNGQKLGDIQKMAEIASRKLDEHEENAAARAAASRERVK